MHWKLCLLPDFTLLQQLPRLLQSLIIRGVASFGVAAASPDWKMKANLNFETLSVCQNSSFEFSFRAASLLFSFDLLF